MSDFVEDDRYSAYVIRNIKTDELFVNVITIPSGDVSDTTTPKMWRFQILR